MKAPGFLDARHRLCLISFLFAASTHGYAADNMLSNYGFDSDIAGWIDSHSATSIDSAWDSRDADGGAGSAWVNNIDPVGSLGVSLQQCIPVIAGRTYRWGGMIFIPSGLNQSDSDQAKLSVQWRASSDCSSSLAGGPVATGPVIGIFDTWIFRSHVGQEAPAGAVAAWFKLLNTKFDAGGSFEVLFDDVYFEEKPFFESSFETGDFLEWSEVVGGPPTALVHLFSDVSCTSSQSQMYAQSGICYPAIQPYYLKVDCGADSSAWYWDAGCSILLETGCGQNMCCPNSVDGTSMVWDCS